MIRLIKYIRAIILGLFGIKSKAVDFFPLNNMPSWLRKQSISPTTRLLVERVKYYPALLEIELRLYVEITITYRVEYTAMRLTINQYSYVKSRKELIQNILNVIGKMVLQKQQ